MEWALLLCLFVLLVSASPAASSADAGSSPATPSPPASAPAEPSTPAPSAFLIAPPAPRPPSPPPSHSPSDPPPAHPPPQTPPAASPLPLLRRRPRLPPHLRPPLPRRRQRLLGPLLRQIRRRRPRHRRRRVRHQPRPLLRDIDDNHVGVDGGSIFSTAAAPACNAGVDLKRGVPMTAWVDYRAARKTLRSGSATRARARRARCSSHPSTSPRSSESSCTSASPPPTAAAPPFTSSATGASAPSASPPLHSSASLSASVGSGHRGIAGVLFLIAASTTVTLWCRFRWNLDCGDCNCGGDDGASSTRSRKHSSVNGEPRMKVPTRISLDEVMSATTEFHDSNILGHGASATVYQGVLPSGSNVVVRLLSPLPRQPSSSSMTAQDTCSRSSGDASTTYFSCS
uniref:Legume lectin domain-containing protein n=1 Tax=Ananas comosus var. bracteatus TaxID=296719 RepID=A0A6V7NJP2_ANACO|nr:unnamed protein product [Ananas comosus var. bracteatus]